MLGMSSNCWFCLSNSQKLMYYIFRKAKDAQNSESLVFLLEKRLTDELVIKLVSKLFLWFHFLWMHNRLADQSFQHRPPNYLFQSCLLTKGPDRSFPTIIRRDKI